MEYRGNGSVSVSEAQSKKWKLLVTFFSNTPTWNPATILWGSSSSSTNPMQKKEKVSWQPPAEFPAKSHHQLASHVSKSFCQWIYSSKQITPAHTEETETRHPTKPCPNSRLMSKTNHYGCLRLASVGWLVIQ